MSRKVIQTCENCGHALKYHPFVPGVMGDSEALCDSAERASKYDGEGEFAIGETSRWLTADDGSLHCEFWKKA